MDLIRSFYNGRINRSTFLSGFLLFVAILLVLILVILGLSDTNSPYGPNSSLLLPLFIVGSIWYFLISSLCVRRLHDLGRNGWWVLLMLISPINFIFLLVLIL